MIAAPQDPCSYPPSGGLAPVAGPKPEILILGSFPSQLSLRHTEYYGNKKNHFWKIMEALSGIDPALHYATRIGQVTAHHIALWDVVASCSRHGSADARITMPVFNNIAGFVAAHPTLRLIALNGSTAARFYSGIAAGISIPSVTLPSTSPANARMTLNEKIQRWSVIQEQE
ncbi:MAG: DNA-deoxyinosine glycosylase [Methanoregula sp.]|jgi:hypoxanthine-DNA glycosylase|nr:DNA-deoxyinosine glycosylase [Methanoregula sp.]